jgi:ElaB/YqjD/DUF883 family membrane-anchored ribosome-binding protein
MVNEAGGGGGSLGRQTVSVEMEVPIMPDDMAKTDEAAGMRPSIETALAPEMAELRRAALVLARKLGSYGLSRAEAIGDELESGSESVLREGRRMAHDLRERVAKVEARLEHGVRDHPGQALAALLGVIGFGLILGLLFRRRD